MTTLKLDKIYKKYHGNVTIFWWFVINHFTIDIEFTFCDFFETSNHTESCWFTTSWRTYENDEFLVFDIDKRVREAAASLGLTEFLDRKPADLSGGQRQRVAMGRAIVRDAKVFLMDEPLSNLDAKLLFGRG